MQATKRATLVVLLLVGLFCAGAVNAQSVEIKVSSQCGEFEIEDTTTTFYVESHKALDLTLDRGSESVVVSLETCTSIGRCDEYCWDHDGNGTKTQCTLDGVGSTSTRGAPTPNMHYMLVTVESPPGASPVEAPEFQACPKW